MYPSIETIQKTLNIDLAQAKQVRGIFDRSINPENYESVKTWINQCYNRPSDRELRMCALNEILHGFGVEAIKIDGHYTDHFWQDLVADYINLGDTYTTTIVYLADNTHLTTGWKLTSWGNIAELYN